MTQFGLKTAALIALTSLSFMTTPNSWAAQSPASPDITITMGSEDNAVTPCAEGIAGCVLTLHASAPNVAHPIFVRNNSNRTVFNIVATLPPGYSDIRQNGSSCRTVLPGAQCNINFRPTLNITHPRPATVLVSGPGTQIGSFILIVVN
jgi:hypothetical protein